MSLLCRYCQELLVCDAKGSVWAYSKFTSCKFFLCVIFFIHLLTLPSFLPNQCFLSGLMILSELLPLPLPTHSLHVSQRKQQNTRGSALFQNTKKEGKPSMIFWLELCGLYTFVIILCAVFCRLCLVSNSCTTASCGPCTLTHSCPPFWSWCRLSCSVLPTLCSRCCAGCAPSWPISVLP